MPKKIIHYECNICHRSYTKEPNAVECEKRGVAKEYPKGMICGSSCKDVTLAVAANNIEGHWNNVSFWACRDNGVGDSLNHLCGGGNYGLLNNNRPDPDHPTFKRMVKALKEKGIKITVWDGKKPVSLNEFMKGHNSFVRKQRYK